MALTDKSRPKTFMDVVGQPFTVSVLSNQVANKTFKHCYLFCGAYGTGKTSMARILASSVNDGEGTPIEMDAASNSGVDSIRSIVQDAQQMPLDCRYKVYIIDEAQNLSKAAWDAALKLIEEPPEHCIFIFCTTEPQKIPSTIMSRVQRFDFHPVKMSVIADRLDFLCNEVLHCDFERSATERIASWANGHVRDAVNALERVYDAEGSIHMNGVEKALGVPSSALVEGFLCGLVDRDAEECLKNLKELATCGVKMSSVYDDIISTALDACVYCVSGTLTVGRVSDKLAQAAKKDAVILKKFSSQAVWLRGVVTDASAYAILTALCFEVCGEGRA